MPRVLASDYQSAQVGFCLHKATNQTAAKPITNPRQNRWQLVRGRRFLFPALRLTHLDSYSLIEIPAPDGTIGRGGANIRATRDDWFQSKHARRLPACVL